MKLLDQENRESDGAPIRPWLIRTETSGDFAAVEDLVNLAFGPGRFAKTAWRLREGVLPDARLSLVAQDSGNDALLGSVRFWPIVAGKALALLLGPLAVVPKLRGRGIGISLMQRGIEAAATLPEYSAIILVGDEPYYARVGFTRMPPGQLRFPGPVDPDRVLGLALKEGALDSLSGEIRRARIDIAVAANAAALGII